MRPLSTGCDYDDLPVDRGRQRHPLHGRCDELLVDAAEDDSARVAERAQVEGEHVGRQQPLRHDVVQKRHGAGRGDRGQAKADDAGEGELLEREVALLAHLEEGLVGDRQVVEVDRVLRDRARDPPRAKLDVYGHATRAEGGRAAALEAGVDGAARRIGRPRVEDHREALGGRADADAAVVLCVFEVVERLVEEARRVLRVHHALDERRGVRVRRVARLKRPRVPRHCALG
eukprot:scaffold11783_cov70-Phaeocystis_antarctica.AAC.3